eukprot:TRINITY_DN446_c0_g1_i6.p1 TRINITY_DN446_c0_g1~~TRINITY_DN446_c0_g1_i6.p1  ORF type:complete len:1091 (+),score=165.96 TRINITY_DN446_c0_g1_i6:283-3555(+)
MGAAKAATAVAGLSQAAKLQLVTGKYTGEGSTRCASAVASYLVGTRSMCMNDGSTGVLGARSTSVFPAGNTIAMTWDRSLMYKRAHAFGKELHGMGVDMVLGPNFVLVRTPTGGRQWEGFGADPWLSGVAAELTTLGIQDNGVIAGPKHWVANEQEHFRNSHSSNMNARVLHEVYGWPFMKSVQAGAGSIMCAFNQYNGQFSCANPYLLNTVLRGEYGFKGFVLSDWGAGNSRPDNANNGMDISTPGSVNWDLAGITDYVNRGLVSGARLNEMCQNILKPFYAMGMDVDPTWPGQVFPGPSTVNITHDHYALIREIAAKGTVLLKNTNDLLPLRRSNIKIAVIGSDAGPHAELNWSPFQGSNVGTMAIGWGSGGSFFPYLIDPLQAIREVVGTENVVPVLDGDWNLPAAEAAAASADVAIVFINVMSGEECCFPCRLDVPGCTYPIDGNPKQFGDRMNMSAQHNGDNLINAVASRNPNTIVVMHLTGQILMPWSNNDNVKAILHAAIPGQESGHSLTDILFGYVNPSGRLVYTIAQQQSDYPAQVLTQWAPRPGAPQVDYSEGLNVDYRWFDSNNIQPLYEFGFGLSYTTFVYSNIRVSGYADPTPDGKDSSVVIYTITASILNNGTRDGEEVAQLYIGFPPALGEPPRVLRGFDKQMIGAGRTYVATFNLTSIDLSVYDIATSKWVLNAGQYVAYIGPSSRKLPLSTTFWIGPIPTSTTTAFSATTAVFSATTAGNLAETTSQLAAHVTTTANLYATSSTLARSTSTTYHAAVTGGFITATTGEPRPDPDLYSKVGLTWPDGDVSNLWALAGNNWNRVAWLYTYSPWNVPAAVLADLDFVPMLVDCSSIIDFENARLAGSFVNSTSLLVFQEPDVGPSSMTPSLAAGIWRDHVQPLASRMHLGAPAVSSGPTGKPWLRDFFTYCSKCTFDFLAVHWFGRSCSAFQAYMIDMHDTFKMPLWVTEYACMAPPSSPPSPPSPSPCPSTNTSSALNSTATSSSSTTGSSSCTVPPPPAPSPPPNRDDGCTVDNISAFVKCSTSWMDSQPWIHRFAPYGSRMDLGSVSPVNSLLTRNGTTHTPLGKQYVEDRHG